MKRALLFLVSLAIINSIESAEQPKPSINQGPAQVAFCYDTWGG